MEKWVFLDYSKRALFPSGKPQGDFIWGGAKGKNRSVRREGRENMRGREGPLYKTLSPCEGQK